MELKRYLYTAEVKSASGHQVFYIDAASREEADARAQAGQSDGIHSEEVMVDDLHELDFTGETSTNDYGDFPEMAPEPAVTPPAPAAVDARDTARYRWLREGDTNLLIPFHVDGCLPTGDLFDAAVDAAMATSQQQEG